MLTGISGGTASMSFVRHACNIGSVYHDSVMSGCVLVSTTSSLIYHFWFLKHHHSAATHHHHRRYETKVVTHENSMHAEQIVIIFYIIFFIFCSMYLVLFSMVLYRTIVTVYADNIFLYNYLWQMHQIIHLSPVWCFTPARGKCIQKKCYESNVNKYHVSIFYAIQKYIYIGNKKLIKHCVNT